MFIKEISKIKNVGQIKNYTNTKNIEFKKFNTIFGNNASGKTTLSTIFRSLKTGDKNAIFIKKTIGVSEPDSQEVEIKIDNITADGIVTYNNSVGWNVNKVQEIEIFDSYFIEKNVLSGYQIGLEHQQNLHNLIIGEEGVEKTLLLQEYKEKLGEISDREDKLTREIKKNVNEFDDFLPSNTKSNNFLKEFYEIPKPNNINCDKNIQDTKNKVKILQTLINNPNQQPFRILEVPVFDKDNFVNNVLHKTLATISKEAEDKVKKHTKIFGMSDAAWLVKGNEFLSDKNICPFCAQSVSGLDLVAAYKAYFSDTYREFRSELNNYQGIEVFNSIKIQEIKNCITMNNEMRKLFQGGITDVWTSIDIEDLTNTLSNLYDILLQTHNRKKAAVLESIDLPAEADELLGSYIMLMLTLKEYNQAILDTNTQLKSLSNDAANELKKAKKNLSELIRTKARHKELNELAETKVRPLIEERKTITDENKRLQASFREYVKIFKETYTISINSYLDQFGANFKIQIDDVNYRGSKPSYDFGIVIDGHISTPIPARSSIDTESSIGNALSEGDKTSLAFALFLAKLYQNETILKNKIIIIDDPISSLDKSRRARTKHIMCEELLQKVSQMFVLSHDEFFLFDCFECNSIKKNEKVSLIVKKNGDTGSEIHGCELFDMTKSKYRYSYDTLMGYKDNPKSYSAIDIPSTIRTYLEGLLQALYPLEFQQNTRHSSLGNYIKKIREGDHKLKSILKELTFLNDFATGNVHHTSQPMPTETEILSAVTSALNIVDNIIK